MVVQAELIKPYVGPHFRIEPVDKICDESDLTLLTEGLRNGRAEILASDLQGNPPYTHVIRYHYTDAATDFLAKIDTSEYLVQYP